VRMTSLVMMTSLMSCLLLLSSVFLPGVEGSVIAFNSSSSSIKPLVSNNLTLTCKLQDTQPTGPAIGKRSVPQSYDVINAKEEEMGREETPQDDVTNSDDLSDLSDLDGRRMRKRSVNQTNEDMKFVTSMVISRNNVDLCSISEHFGVTQLTSDVTVAGHLNTGQGERGMLQLTWPHPSQAEAGSYKCEVNALNAQGRSFIFSQTLDVVEEEASINDLVVKMHRMELEKEKMQVTIAGQASTIRDQSNTIRDMKSDNDVMNMTIADQAKTIHDMNMTIDEQSTSIRDLKKNEDSINKTLHILGVKDQSLTNSIHQLNLTDQALLQSDKTMTSQISSVNQSLTSLRDVARVEPDVFFSAILSLVESSMSVNQVLIFDKVVSNEGQSYNSQTGIFTSPLDGFYEFQVHALSYDDHTFYLELQHNGSRVISVNKNGDEYYGGVSNSVIVKLGKHDQVKVVCWTTTTYVANLYNSDTTFSGRLVALL